MDVRGEEADGGKDAGVKSGLNGKQDCSDKITVQV